MPARVGVEGVKSQNALKGRCRIAFLADGDEGTNGATPQGYSAEEIVRVCVSASCGTALSRVEDGQMEWPTKGHRDLGRPRRAPFTPRATRLDLGEAFTGRLGCSVFAFRANLACAGYLAARSAGSLTACDKGGPDTN